LSLPFELFIGLRYTRAKRRNHFISFISIASMLGIALGIAALITVMSVMNGFVKEIRARMLSITPHVQIVGGEAGLQDWQTVRQMAARDTRVQATAPFVFGQGMLANGAVARGAVIRGIDPAAEDAVTDIARQMKAGALSDLRAGAFGLVLGGDLARALRVGLGDKVTLITTQGSVTPAGIVPRLKVFSVVGIFSVGHFQYDDNFAFLHLADAQLLYRTGDAVSGLRLKIGDAMAAPEVTRDLLGRLPPAAFVTDWTRDNATYFRAVQIEKRMMFIILTLIIAVAAFNLVSMLVMAVTDKEPDIAILRTLGATPGSIMKIFVVQGAMIGVIGTLAGALGGVLLAHNIGAIVQWGEGLLGMRVLSPEVYYITALPSDVQGADVWSVTGVSLVLSLFATLYPSWRAARVNPAEALRYE
jgi:lipoprotein-releasing system permease protein